MGLANYTKGSGYLTSSILEGSNTSTGVYTLVEDNEVINFYNPSNSSNNFLEIISITIYAKGTALKIVPGGNELFGFIYIPENQSKIIQGGSFNKLKVLNTIGTEIYFEATYI